MPLPCVLSHARASGPRWWRTYWQHAQEHYQKHGRPTQEQSRIRGALRGLRSVCGTLPADRFNVDHLERVRDHYIGLGYTRDTRNAYAGIVKRMFRWAGAKQLTRRGIFGELRDLLPLERGRGGVIDGNGVEPVSVANVLRTLPHMQPSARDLCRFLGVTACRPEEGCIARACDLIPHAKLGRVYRPQWHKTEHKGVQRFVPISEAAWALLAPLIQTAPNSHLFINWRTGARFTPDMLGHEVARACAIAWPNPHDAELRRLTLELRRSGKWRGGLRIAGCRKQIEQQHADLLAAARQWRREHSWSPGQLRHSKLTQIRHCEGLEAAQRQASHTSARMTEIYAELTPDPIDIDAALVWSWSAPADAEALIDKLSPNEAKL